MIIFLTGCANRGYHTELVPVTPPAVLESAAVFDWPLKGRVVSPFGAKEEGVSLKGVLIEGREGEEVLAANDGTVIFVDEKLAGYGKTVIVDHGGAWATVYARNSEILVRAGQAVRRGQAIAKVGRGGKKNISQLYFEIRNKSRAHDPARYLQKKSF